MGFRNVKDIKPTGTVMLVELLDAPKESKGGIILPDTKDRSVILAKVLAVGPGEMKDSGILTPPPAKEGQTVVLGCGNYRSQNAEPITGNGQHVFVDIHDVYAVMD